MDNKIKLLKEIRSVDKKLDNLSIIEQLLFSILDSKDKLDSDFYESILFELNKLDEDIVFYNSPLNFLYALSNYNLSEEVYFEYVFAWLLLVNAPDKYTKLHLRFLLLQEHFSEKWKELLIKYIENDVDTTESIKLLAYGLVTKDKQEGVKYFTKALLEDVNNWVANINLALYYDEIRNFENSVKQYENILKHNRQGVDFLGYTADVLFSLGTIYCFEIKDFYKAEVFLKECVELYPDTQGVYNNYGYCLYRLRKYKSSEKFLKKSVQAEEDKEIPLWNLLRVYSKTKDYEKSLKILKRLEKVSRKAKTIENEIKSVQKKIATGDNNISIKDYPIEENVRISLKHRELKSIGQESILEDLIHQKIINKELVFQRQLKIYEDNLFYGRQLVMPEVGRLDLLVIDLQTKEMIVIELKKDESYNDVIGQTLRYVKWIKENIGKKYKVKGLICLHKANDSLIKEARIHNIEIQEYDFNFRKK